MKIDLPILHQSPYFLDPFFTVVTAEIVDVAPHLSDVATFAVHASDTLSAIGYVVSNVETGQRVTDRNSKRGAIKVARDFLATKTHADIEYGYAIAPDKARL